MPVFLAALIGGSLIFGLLWRADVFNGGRRRCGGYTIGSLRTLVTAQMEFRVNDFDGDDINQFWRRDIAGLYTVVWPQNSTGLCIKLIELATAAADAVPVTNIEDYALRGPKDGYWFRTLLHAGEKEPSPDRFAVCAYPDCYHPSECRWTFIVDEKNQIHRKDLGRGGGVAVFPFDPAAEGWIKLD